MPEQQRIALLIDCDNTSYQFIEGVLEELAKYGAINLRHAYGDWHSPQLNGWRSVIQTHAIKPMQQEAYTKGKNATDIAMVIEAMEILYKKHIDAFALMSSDADFTPLVFTMRENGLPVYGFGQKKTPTPFVNACTRFIYIENLQPQTQEDDNNETHNGEIQGIATDLTAYAKNKPIQRVGGNQLKMNTALIRLLRTAIEHTEGDDGWANFGQVGSYISNHSSFSSINYGYAKLGDIVKAIDIFETKTENSSLYVQDKRTAKVAKKKVTKKTVVG